MTRLWIVMLATVVTMSCTSQPAKPAAKTLAPESITGRAAFQKLYVAAHGWAPDAQAFLLSSEVTGDSKGRDGQAGTWRASFASPGRHRAKSYLWSGMDAAGEVERGVNPGTEDSYNPENTSTLIFEIAYLKIDTDKALEIGQKHGGEKLLGQAPDTPVLYVLDWDRSSSQLVWHVIYGANRDEAKLRVSVDATTGDFLRVEK